MRPYFRRVFATGLVCLVLSAVIGCAQPAGPTLRVVTWNVHACQAGVDQIVAQIRELNPDVVCLQEVESGLLGSPGIDEASQIARGLGMYYVCTPHPEKGTKEEQIAIFARGELDDPVYLENGTGRRYGLSAELELRDDSEIRIVAIHLTSNSTSDIGRFLVTGFRRLREVSDLVRRIDGWDGDTIMVGDFNAVPGMVEHAAIATRMSWAGRLGPTYPNHAPRLPLDHVFLKGNLRPASVLSVKTEASDHRPLMATIRLKDRWTLQGLSGPALFESPDQDDRENAYDHDDLEDDD